MADLSTLNMDQIARLLAAARQTISTVHKGWIATQAENGGAHARAVRLLPGLPDDDEWTRQFLSRKVSRKIAEIRREPRVTLAYQDASGDAYVALGGQASLSDDPAEIGSLWPETANAFFPPGFAEANMLVVKIDVDRIEVHIRGLTGEPFGHGRTLIERTGPNNWRFIPAAA